jgi:hypothetical protein
MRSCSHPSCRAGLSVCLKMRRSSLKSSSRSG